MQMVTFDKWSMALRMCESPLRHMPACRDTCDPSRESFRSGPQPIALSCNESPAPIHVVPKKQFMILPQSPKATPPAHWKKIGATQEHDLADIWGHRHHVRLHLATPPFNKNKYHSRTETTFHVAKTSKPP